jgi:putative transposase
LHETSVARNYYSEINLHVVWHVKDSRPLLTPAVETVIYEYLRQRLINTRGVYVHEIGGIETHVHLAISIQPTIEISGLIGELKGSSSHHANHQNTGRDKVLEWQSGYGVVSFGTRDLPWVVEYIRNQREHHRGCRVFDRLERITDDEASRRVNPHYEKPRERGCPDQEGHAHPP